MTTPRDPARDPRTPEELQAEVSRLIHEATRAAATALEPSRRHSGAVSGAPGASALIAHRGEVVARAFSGHDSLLDAHGVLLEPGARTPIGGDHLWDIASITKTVVAMAALVQIDRGHLDPHAAVSTYLPRFADAPAETSDRAPEAAARSRVTIAHLLTHTAGLPPVLPLWRVPGSRDARVERLLGTPLTHEPGTRHVYSCVGYMTLGLVLETVTGLRLPDLVARTVTEPLGMDSTTYAPPPERAVAATELQDGGTGPVRGLVRGEVHDEAAWALGGAGNAGLFSDAEDLLRLGEEVRTGNRGLLTESSRALLRTGVLEPGEVRRLGYDQAVGLRLGQSDVMGGSEPTLVGHTGFVGTSLVIDLDRELVVVLLTNRVHPRRDVFDVNPVRRRLATLARIWADGRPVAYR